jgi:ABC-type antimicrobial peptide transport system permease subunit
VVGVDGSLALGAVTTQRTRARTTFAPERVMAELLTAFGLLALALAAVGLGGLQAYSVAQRTGEIGIRMALGAGVDRVLRLVLGQGLRLAVVGIAAGALATLAAKGVIGSELYGVSGADPLTFAVVAGGLLAVSALACWLPARRAARVDPVIALRSE